MNDECNFVVGQKVVCVDDDVNSMPPVNGFYRVTNSMDGLTKNEIYTIRNVYVDPVSGRLLVHLEEIFRGPQYPNMPDSLESGYTYSRFRPLRDLTIFNEILRNVNVPSREFSGTDA
jgi:hypothetical protein